MKGGWRFAAEPARTGGVRQADHQLVGMDLPESEGAEKSKLPEQLGRHAEGDVQVQILQNSGKAAKVRTVDSTFSYLFFLQKLEEIKIGLLVLGCSWLRQNISSAIMFFDKS